MELQNDTASVKNANAKNLTNTVSNHVAKEAVAKPANGTAQNSSKLKDELAKPNQLPQQPEPKENATSLTLESKLKVVNELHRRSIHRLNLINRMKQLEDFVIAQDQDNDELEDNAMQGCKLTIEDDQHRRFVTTTPGLIRLVSQFIFTACDKKLAEIESAINFPTV